MNTFLGKGIKELAVVAAIGLGVCCVSGCNQVSMGIGVDKGRVNKELPLQLMGRSALLSKEEASRYALRAEIEAALVRDEAVRTQLGKLFQWTALEKGRIEADASLLPLADRGRFSKRKFLNWMAPGIFCTVVPAVFAWRFGQVVQKSVEELVTAYIRGASKNDALHSEDFPLLRVCLDNLTPIINNRYGVHQGYDMCVEWMPCLPLAFLQSDMWTSMLSAVDVLSCLGMVGYGGWHLVSWARGRWMEKRYGLLEQGVLRYDASHSLSLGEAGDYTNLIGLYSLIQTTYILAEAQCGAIEMDAEPSEWTAQYERVTSTLKRGRALLRDLVKEVDGKAHLAAHPQWRDVALSIHLAAHPQRLTRNGETLP